MENKKPTKKEFIDEIRSFFDNVEILPVNVPIPSGGIIRDPKKFIESHIKSIETLWGRHAGRPYVARLLFYRSQIPENESTND